MANMRLEPSIFNNLDGGQHYEIQRNGFNPQG
jgi:hypothetical protein